MDSQKCITLSYVLLRPRHPHNLDRKSAGKISKTLGGLLFTQRLSGDPGIGDSKCNLLSLWYYENVKEQRVTGICTVVPGFWRGSWGSKLRPSRLCSRKLASWTISSASECAVWTNTYCVWCRLLPLLPGKVSSSSSPELSAATVTSLPL